MQNNICVDRRKVNLDLMCYLFLIFLTGCLVDWVYEEIFYWITEGLEPAGSRIVQKLPFELYAWYCC